MRIRHFSLMIAGVLVLGAWITPNPAVAAPRTVVGGASRANLTLPQQDLANAWYNELGKIKRKGLGALKRGDCDAVDSSIVEAGVVAISAKNGEGALGTLPIFIRQQIADEGRRVAWTLAGRCGSARDGRIQEAGRNRTRTAAEKNNAKKDAKAKKDNVVYAISNFFIRLGSVQTSPSQSKSGSPRRKNAAADQRAPYVYLNTAIEFLGFTFLENKHPEAALPETAARYSDARVALSEGTPSAKVRYVGSLWVLERLAKNARSPRVRKLARSYLSRLPKRFVSGHAYTRDDRTSAADPDPRVRFTLKRSRYSKDAGDGADGGDD